jgi:hypothetical protein
MRTFGKLDAFPRYGNAALRLDAVALSGGEQTGHHRFVEVRASLGITGSGKKLFLPAGQWRTWSGNQWGG